MDVEDAIESRKKLDEQRKRLQRQLREVERFTDVPQEVQSSIKDNLQQQHQRAQKRSQQIQNIQEKQSNVQKETAAAREEMRKIREEITQKEERLLLLSDKVDKNEMAETELEAALQGLQAGEERRGSNASQAVDCCLETVVEHNFAVGTDQARPRFRCHVPNVLQEIRDPYSSCADARKRRRKKGE